MGHRSQGNEWRTVGGPHALVFLEANQLCDPGINHGFEPDYGGGPGGATGTRRLAGPRREAQDELGCGRGRPALGRTSGLDMCCAARGPLKPATVLFEGDDPRAYIIARIARRHMSKGQQAMAVAMMYPEPAKTKTQGPVL
jgi:hypothetical protein